MAVELETWQRKRKLSRIEDASTPQKLITLSCFYCFSQIF